MHNAAQTSGSKALTIVMVLSILSIFPPLATDMYLSSFNDIQAHLAAPDGALELSLSVFFLGLCVGQLVFGPLIDRFGRKGPLLIGAGLFCVATLLLLLTSSTSMFIGLRFIQALGACGGMVVGRAVVTDLYEGKAAARTMTLLVMLMTIGPVVSPLLGGILDTNFGWRSVFVTMLAVGVLALVLAMTLLPETLPASKRLKTPFAGVFGHYWKLLISRRFVVPALVSSFAQAAMFSFITASSSVFQGVLGLGKIEYGLAFGFVALGLVVASFVNNWLLSKLEVKTIISAALPLFVAISLVLLLVSGTHQLWVLIIPLWFSIAMVGLISANGTSIAMEATRGQSGVGSALVGAMQFGVAFVCSAIVASAITASALPLALGILLPAIVALVLWFVGRGPSGNEDIAAATPPTSVP
ncbi:multidrug effflux MFS transporter [Paracoccus sp. DMF]|uniref:multidrug effflux MFS transporter n=1 Tax=unclassified Paracoccus (in: a-proteobacteria) TaxID=2688777 RepID=UPI0011008C76|nr:multidrug effflux MFS transporter [Paracoccus sp. DMF]MCV2449497.1 multidrug effflux MFS transporter [Paracoccus sp. DMF]